MNWNKFEIYKNSCIWVHSTDVLWLPSLSRQKAEIHKQIPKNNVAVMARNGPSPHFPSLRLGLTPPQPSRRHHTQSLLRSSFHDPRTPHVLESHPKRAAPLSRHDDERRHAVGSHSALALRLYLAACNPSSSCRFWILDHLCSNLSQSFHLCWIKETRSLNLCVSFTFSSHAFAFLIEMNFSFKSLFAIWLLSPQYY